MKPGYEYPKSAHGEAQPQVNSWREHTDATLLHLWRQRHIRIEEKTRAAAAVVDMDPLMVGHGDIDRDQREAIKKKGWGKQYTAEDIVEHRNDRRFPRKNTLLALRFPLPDGKVPTDPEKWLLENFYSADWQSRHERLEVRVLGASNATSIVK